MIPKECKCLTEVDSPIAVVGRQSNAANGHAELLARRERRRWELQQQRFLTPQAVERTASVLVLPHPYPEAPEVRYTNPSQFRHGSFPMRKVSKSQHRWLDVNAMTQPMQNREDSPPSGGRNV